MVMGEYFQEAVAHVDFDRDGIFSAKNRKPDPDSVLASDDKSSGKFECNICLDSVRDPVVTLCGHLYCWACIYKWLHLHSISTQDEDQRQKRCPVCKAKVSSRTLVPLYGRGQSTIQGEVKDIPRRPLGPIYRFDMPRSQQASGNLRMSQRIHLNYPHGTQMLSAGRMSSSSTVLDPLIVMFGEMVCTRLFGTNYTYPDGYNLSGNSGPRMRRQMMQAEKSLSRICFFLMCCVILCLFLF